MMKRLFCILLSLMLLLAAPFALAEDAAAEPAAETPAEETAAEAAEAETPVLLVTVNGEEIWSNNDYLLQVRDYYLDYASQYGYDVSDQSMIDTINAYSLQYTVRTALIRQKAAELGLDQITDEEKAAMEEEGKAQWAEIVNNFIESAGTITEDSTDDDKAAAKADAEAQLLLYGYDEAKYTSEYVQNQTEGVMTERLMDYLIDGKTVSDEDIQAYFNELVEEDKAQYETDVSSYEFYTQYYGQPSYYTPEGYRAVNHILLAVDEGLMSTWKDLSARLEEQENAENAETTDNDEAATEETASDETPVPDADPTEEPTPTPEPVTKEMVDEAEKAILDSVQATVDEIKAKLDSGVSFEDLIQEYGTDPGMEDEAKRAEGYLVHEDSILWDPAFAKAAMALEKIGDISEPVLGQYGVHILQYLRDVPGGAVELTDDMKEEFRSTLESEMRNEALNTALDEWEATVDIVYTEAGEAWKVPAEEAAAEETAEAPADETAPAEETPAE